MTGRGEGIGAVTSCVAEALGLPAAEIDPGTPLLALGLDSFTAVRLRRRLLDRTGVGLDLSDFFGDASVSTVAAKLGECVPVIADGPSAPEGRAAAPRERPRPGQDLPAVLSQEDWSALVALSRSRALAPESTLLAALGLTLARWTVKCPVALCTSGITPFSGITVKNAEIGLPELDLTRWEGFAHYAAHIDLLLRGSERTRASASAITFTAQEGPARTDAHPGGRLECRAWEEHGALRLEWRAADIGLADEYVQAMLAAHVRLLRRLGDDAWSDRELGWDPGFLEPERLDRSPFVGAGPRLDDPLIEAARRRPRSMALLGAAAEVTHGELAGRAGRIAAMLARSGVGPGDLIAVSFPKEPDQIAAVLGTTRSGAGYVPVDPSWPAARVESVCAAAGIKHALVGEDDAAIEWPDGVQMFPLCSTGEFAPAACGSPRPRRPDPEELAYVIFTSGSTGTPKGVAIEHRAARTTVDDITDRFAVRAEDRVLALSALGFDLSVYDIFGVLGAGGALVLPDDDRLLDPGHWLDLISRYGVTLWNTAPALMEMLVEHAEGDPEDARARLGSLRTVLLSGDWIPVTLPDRLRALAVNAEVISLGGATEASIWSICHPIGEVDPSLPSIPYGRPLRDQSFYILDETGRPCAVGSPGELFIGGKGLAREYVGHAEETAARFRTHEGLGQRLYRTGDLGRWRPDGLIEFLGRVDRQVKIRGHRIELGEIEAVLTRHPEVRQCVAAVVSGPDAGRHLVAYVAPRDVSRPPEEQRLVAALRERVPPYMVPSRFQLLDSFPVTANGKVDYAALPDPYEANGAPDGRTEHRVEG